MTVHQSQQQFAAGLCPMCQELHKAGIVMSERRAQWAGGAVQLTRRQAAIFAFLLKRRSASGESLAMEVYGLDPNGGPDDAKNCIDVFVWQLRKRLRDAAFPGHIETVWGSGYRLVVAETVEKGA